MSVDLAGALAPLAAAAERVRKIYPPEGYWPGWWVVAAVCALGIVLVIWWASRALRRLHPDPRGESLLAAVRRDSLARIDAVAREFESGDLDAPAAHQRLSAEVRRFAGTATNGQADYLVLPELRRAAVKDPRLDAVVAFVETTEEPAFASATGHTVDVGAALSQARQVVQRWT